MTPLVSLSPRPASERRTINSHLAHQLGIADSGKNLTFSATDDDDHDYKKFSNNFNLLAAQMVPDNYP